MNNSVICKNIYIYYNYFDHIHILIDIYDIIMTKCTFRLINITNAYVTVLLLISF